MLVNVARCSFFLKALSVMYYILIFLSHVRSRYLGGTTLEVVPLQTLYYESKYFRLNSH